MSKYTTLSKRQALHQVLQSQSQDHQDQPLLPGLPDHIAHLCLSNVSPSTLFNVCHSWRRLIYSPSFPPFLSLYTILSSSSSDSNSNSSIHFFSFDPISSHWHLLPPPPPDPQLCFLLHHPSFLSRSLPIQSVSVSGKLILLAATTHNFHPALTRPLIFDPIRRNWTYGPELVNPRRWCAAGSLRNAVYVASGMGSQFSSDVAKSVEKWSLGEKTNNNNNDHNNSKWEKVRELKNGRFSREAIDAVGWKGKLCVVNVKGVEGILYDVVENKWEEMAEGMVKGWRGPVAAMEEEVLFVIDESNGSLRRYDEGLDDWVEIVTSELLKGAKYVAAAGGRVCAICESDAVGVGGGSRSKVVVVNVTAVPAKICVVDTPTGFEALTLHILPRMSE